MRPERAKKKLEKAYSFMIRVRLPGGVHDLEAVAAARRHRRHLRQPHAAPDDAPDVPVSRRHQVEHEARRCRRSTPRCSTRWPPAATSTATSCAAANPYPVEGARRRARARASTISEHLLPQTGAYHEIWLDGEQVIDESRPAKTDEEPIYGTHYLPRKFKIVIAVPPSNDVDIFAHDLGYIAIVESGKLVGWNVTVGGGMGMTHGEPDTFPRTADVLGFCTPEQAIDVAEKVVTVQRDWGNRHSRKRARLKYTIEDRGLDAFRAEVEKRLGYASSASRARSSSRRPATSSAGSRAPTRSGT